MLLKEKGSFAVEEAYELKEGDRARAFSIERDICCDRARPARMQALTLRPESAAAPAVDEARILLQDIDDGSTEWIQSLKGPEALTRMVILDSWEAYDAIRGKLQDMVDAGGGYIA